MFVADENVESAIVSRPRADGHDVIWIAEAEPGVAPGQVRIRRP